MRPSPPPPPPAAPPTRAEPFRDARAGAEARRDQLLARARERAAVQPLVLRTVYVRRVSRRATGFALALVGLVLGLASVSDFVYDLLTAMIPGHAPAPLATLLLAAPIVGLQVVFIARALAESRFTHAMRASVLATDDPYRDIDRLEHLSSADVAARLARITERGSVFGPLAALATLAPSALAYGVAAVRAGAVFPDPALVESSLLASGPLRLASILMLLALAARLAARLRTARGPEEAVSSSLAIVGAASVVLLVLVGLGVLWFCVVAIPLCTVAHARAESIASERGQIADALAESRLAAAAPARRAPPAAAPPIPHA